MSNDKYTSTGSLLDSVKGVDAVVIATNHAAFRQVDLSEVKAQMNPDPVLSDRKSTRLNSSHGSISYAVFCLKKKKKNKHNKKTKNKQRRLKNKDIIFKPQLI